MITSAIFAWAESQPDKAALEHNGEVWSYAAFAEAIARSRSHFRGLRLEGEGVVVVAVEQLRDWWVASLALRSLGLTTIAVREAVEVADLGLPDLRAVVGAPSSWNVAEVCRRVGVPALEAGTGDAPALPLEAGVQPGGHILRTSGTTGAFKMVLMDPAFEPAYFRRRLRSNGIRRESVVSVLDFGPWTGVGYKSPVGTWSAGGTVVFSQARPIRQAFQRSDLTHATLVPSLLAELLAEPAGAFPRSQTMQLGVTGGTMTQSQIDEVKARITPVLVNGLGATESHPIAVTRIETPDDHRWHTPCEGVIEIVDDAGRPVPTGQIGRLRIDTADGPKGYLNDPGATRAFFKDGFFYPGDLAVMREDGRFALMGRVTDVINVKGHKITPAPIEDRLREALGVSGVCLLSMQDTAGEEGLHAVIETQQPLDTAALAPVLQREIGGFAGVRVHFVSALPRNEAGKVLRQAVAADLARWQQAPQAAAQ